MGRTAHAIHTAMHSMVTTAEGFCSRPLNVARAAINLSMMIARGRAMADISALP